MMNPEEWIEKNGGDVWNHAGQKIERLKEIVKECRIEQNEKCLVFFSRSMTDKLMNFLHLSEDGGIFLLNSAILPLVRLLIERIEDENQKENQK